MSVYTLENDRLKVTFAALGDYTGTRFDHMGMIQSVTLDTNSTFYAQESLVEGEGSGGQGFYNEFGIEDPIGYDEAGIGEQFPKIGVGALTKDSAKPYDFFYTYPMQPFTFDVDHTPTCITFHSKHHAIRGYAVAYTKKVHLIDNQMLVSYTLENTGTRPIKTTEYCHNFVSINHQPIGPDYELSFSYPVHLEHKLGTFAINDSKLVFPQTLEDVMYCKFTNLPKGTGHFSEVIHRPSGVGFRETSDFPLERVAVWGMPHVISPEAFIKILLQPGQTQTWTRTYTFFN